MGKTQWCHRSRDWTVVWPWPGTWWTMVEIGLEQSHDELSILVTWVTYKNHTSPEWSLPKADRWSLSTPKADCKQACPRYQRVRTGTWTASLVWETDVHVIIWKITDSLNKNDPSPRYTIRIQVSDMTVEQSHEWTTVTWWSGLPDARIQHVHFNLQVWYAFSSFVGLLYKLMVVVGYCRKFEGSQNLSVQTSLAENFTLDTFANGIGLRMTDQSIVSISC